MQRYQMVTRWFWAWQTQQECAWLRQKSKEGWEFVGWHPPQSYTFRKTDPPQEFEFLIERKALLFNPGTTKMEAYLNDRAAQGWAFIAYTWGWAFFRRPTDTP